MLPSILFALYLLFPAQEQEWPYLQEVPRKIQSRMNQALQAGDLDGLFTLHEVTLEKYAGKFVRDPQDKTRYHSFLQILRAEIRRNPGAREAFRNRYGTVVHESFLRVRKAGDLAGLEKMADRWFLAEGIAEAFDEIAQRKFVEGKLALAASTWERAREHCLPGERLYPVLVARLANTYHLLQKETALDRIKSLGSEKLIVIGGKRTTLSRFLASLEIRKETDVPKPDLPPRHAGESTPSTQICLGRLQLDSKIQKGHQTLVTRIMEFPGRTVIFANTGRRVHALQPERGDGKSLQNGVYWSYPASRAIRTDRMFRGSITGCTPSGDGKLYATLLSRTRPSPKRGTTPMDGPTRLVAFDARNGRILWDTENIQLGWKEGEFVFTTDPVLRNGKIFLAGITGPSGEREALLFCFDASSGRLLWTRFLAAGAPLKTRYSMAFPQVLLSGNRIHIATNVGAVITLRTMDGAPSWATTYPSLTPGSLHDPRRIALREIFRAPSPPVLSGKRLYILPQDKEALIALDAGSGKPLPLEWKGARIDWKMITRLTGVGEDWLFLGGLDSWMLQISTSTAFQFHELNANLLPGGKIRNRDLLLPFHSEGSAGLTLLDGSREWKKKGEVLFRGKPFLFHFDFRGPYLAVIEGTSRGNQITASLAVYTSLRHIRDRFHPKVEADPPDPEAALRLAQLFRANDLWKEARKAYKRFFLVADGDPRWEEVVKEARWWLETVGEED